MTDKPSVDIVKYLQFFIGLGMGFITLYFSSTQWVSKHTELLFEIRELRKDYIKIDTDITKLMTITSSHEKSVTRYEIKLDMLEVKLSILEKEIREKKKIGLIQ